MGIEQHLMGLQQIGPDQEGSAVRQLDVGDLQFGALAAEDCIILAPIELERLARPEGQRNEGAAARPWAVRTGPVAMSAASIGRPAKCLMCVDPAASIR